MDSRFCCWPGGGREWLRYGWLVGSDLLLYPCDGAWRAWCSHWRALPMLRGRCYCPSIARRSAAGAAYYTRTSLSLFFLSFASLKSKREREREFPGTISSYQMPYFSHCVLFLLLFCQKSFLSYWQPSPHFRRVKWHSIFFLLFPTQQ